jgi:hypothetical protein
VAASTPTGPSSPLVRTLGILSVLIALAGVITIFAKGSDNDNSSSAGGPGTGGTPIATPTGLGSSSPPPATITPIPSAGRHTHSSAPVPSASATTTTSSRPRRSATPSTPASSPTPQSSPTSTGRRHHVTLQLPTLGNYSYATTGGEQTSIPGTGRTWPKTTTISVTKSGCGINQTWKPLSTHVETQQLCLIHNQVHLISYQTTLTFFGQTITQRFTCARNAYIYSPALKPGDRWSFTCTTQGAKVVQHLKAVGYQTFDVGGTKVRTLHISIPSNLGGGDSGTSQQDLWIAATNRPMEIRDTSSIDAKQSGVAYKESRTLQLKHLQPS